MLSRLYWYTIEFGLIRQRGAARVWRRHPQFVEANCAYAVQSPEPQRLPLRLERTMRTRYKIDSFQQTYFVIDSFEQLFAMTDPDFGPMYERLRGNPNWQPMRAIGRWRQRHGRRKLPRFSLHAGALNALNSPAPFLPGIQPSPVHHRPFPHAPDPPRSAGGAGQRRRACRENDVVAVGIPAGEQAGAGERFVKL
jgi:hypothetical protein